jgi:glutathione S-transferase
MTYTLYGRLGSGSGACEAVLALSGLPYEVVEVEKGADGRPSAEFLAINPLGQVPTLVLPNGEILTESAAIILYLADIAPQVGLAPLIDSAKRPVYLRWMVFLSANIYMNALNYYYCERYSTQPSAAPGIKASADQRIVLGWSVYEAGLGKQGMMLGDQLSAVDVYAGMLAFWRDDLPAFRKQNPKIARLMDRLVSHPVVGPIWEEHGMVL